MGIFSTVPVAVAGIVIKDVAVLAGTVTVVPVALSGTV